MEAKALGCSIREMARYGAVLNVNVSDGNDLELKKSSGRDRSNMSSFVDDFNPRDRDFWEKVSLLQLHACKIGLGRHSPFYVML